MRTEIFLEKKLPIRIKFMLKSFIIVMYGENYNDFVN